VKREIVGPGLLDIRRKKDGGIRILEDIQVGYFVFEFVENVITNFSNLAHHNKVYVKCNKHVYNILLHANEDNGNLLNDEETLCLDGTRYGKVSKFLNH
jgi:hypothetical protein